MSDVTKFAKLISEKECVILIDPNISIEDLRLFFLNPILKTLIEKISYDIENAKLSTLHHYRFEIKVHAQEPNDYE